MHLQENTDVAQYPLHHVTYAHVKFEVATYNGLGGDALTRKYTQNVAQYPLHYLTYTHMHSLKLLYPTVWEKMHIQENSL